MACALKAEAWRFGKKYSNCNCILKTVSHHRVVLAPEDRDVNRGPVFPSDLGLQDQRYVDGALGRDDSIGAGTREQHSGRVLVYLVGETSQRDNKPPAG